MRAGFISLTKTGHSSISQMLPHVNEFPNFNLEWLRVGKHRWLKDNGHISTSDQLNNYDILFSSVRNPVDRFVSSYQECCKTYGYQKTIHELLEDYQAGSLSAFQMWHVQPQSFHLIKEDLNFIIRLENINEDIKKLASILRVSTRKRIPWVNQSTSEKPKLDKKITTKIEEEFSECMNQFNY